MNCAYHEINFQVYEQSAAYNDVEALRP